MTSASISIKPSGPASGILYLAAIVILLDQSAILAASIYPIAAGSVNWRFGAVGLLAGRATPFLLADLLLIAGGMLAGHRGFLRFLAVLHVLITVLLLAALGMFVLDTLEVRQLIPLEAREQALASATRAAIALFTVAIYCLMVAVRVIRTTPPRSSARSADRRIVLEGHAGASE
ncbi:MAG TPA: hypothetical protein VJU15_04135 [Gemmatimonadales bacterium]|nr:hypothetical protein [Gemmatimonadales bacterium]